MTTNPKDTIDTVRYPDAWCGHVLDRPEPDLEDVMSTIAEDMALELAGLVGELSAVVEWCVERDGECLGDNPKQLAHAKKILAKARARLPQGTPTNG